MSKLRHSSVSNFTSAKIFDSSIYIGLLIFVLSLPFGYSTLFLNIGMLLVLLGWVGRIISERKLSWHRTPIDIPIILFLGLALVASLFAPHRASSSIGFFWKLLRCSPTFLCCYPQSLRRSMAAHCHSVHCCSGCLINSRTLVLLQRYTFRARFYGASQVRISRRT